MEVLFAGSGFREFSLCDGGFWHRNWLHYPARRMCSLFLLSMLVGHFWKHHLGEILCSLRPLLCRPQVLGKDRDQSVTTEFPVTGPVFGRKLTKDQLLGPVKYQARYRNTRRRVVFGELVLGGRRGHAIRFTSVRVELSTGAPHVSGFFVGSVELAGKTRKIKHPRKKFPCNSRFPILLVTDENGRSRLPLLANLKTN
jgi:hypothetical protein